MTAILQLTNSAASDGLPTLIMKKNVSHDYVIYLIHCINKSIIYDDLINNIKTSKSDSNI